MGEDSRHADWCEALYREKGAELILYGRALGLSHGEAEDVLQETFVSLMALHGSPSKAEYYALRTYRNRAFNHRRSLWRRIARELESRRWFERSVQEQPGERAMKRALSNLPVEQREVIVLKIWHEQTFEEIGAFLEISPNTAAGRYRYGLEKLKSAMKGVSYEQNEEFGERLALVDTPPTL